MLVSVVHPRDLGRDEAELWASFQRNSERSLSPFLSLTFAKVVGESRSNARVAVIEEDGKIKAFLPFEMTAGRIGLPIGYPMNDLQGIIMDAEHQLDARMVVRKAGLRGWRFYHTPLEQRALVVHCYEHTTIRCTVMNLEKGYKQYLSELSKSVTKKMIYQKRSLERHHGPVSLLWNSTTSDHLARLMSWKAGKYSSIRQLFEQDDTVVRIIEQLARSRNRDCSGVLGVLQSGERAVAAHLGLLGPDGLYSWFPSYEDELSRFSPGMTMWLPMAEEAAKQGIYCIDFGYGQHSYKFRLANDSYTVVGGAIWGSAVEARARRAYRFLNEKFHSHQVTYEPGQTA